MSSQDRGTCVVGEVREDCPETATGAEARKNIRWDCMCEGFVVGGCMTRAKDCAKDYCDP